MAGRRGARRAPEPAGDRARSRDDAQRGREAPGRRMDGPRRPVLQRSVRSERERAHRSTAEPGDFRDAGCPADPAARRAQPACHQAIGSSTSAAPIGTSFRNNRFVLTGDARGRLRRDAVDDLERLQRGFELPAQPAVDGAASGHAARRRRRRRCCRSAAPNYNTIANWISTGCSTPDDRTANGTLPLDHVAAEPWRACGRRASNPLGNPPVVSNPRRARGGQHLSFAYFQRCINPIFLAQLPIPGQRRLDQHLRRLGLPRHT